MRLDHNVRELVVELARAQDFKCAFCDETQGLIIEHDHYPKHGSGENLLSTTSAALPALAAIDTWECAKPTGEVTTAASMTPIFASMRMIFIHTLKLRLSRAYSHREGARAADDAK